MGFSLFPSFFDHPQNIRFSEQEENEHIELMVRQHWVTNLGWITAALAAAILPAFLPILSQALNLSSFLEIPYTITWALVILWYLLVITYVVENYIYWYFNIYIITDRHLVDIALHSLLSRNITEVRIEDVESARTKMAGVGRALFNFGDVIIETAAERQRIEFLAVPYPVQVADRIQDLQEGHRGGKHAA